MVALLCCAFILEEHRANSFFSVKEVRSLRELVCVRGAYQYFNSRIVEGWDETSIRIVAAALMYEHELDAAFFAERATDAALRRYAILAGFETFARVPGDIVQSMDYPNRLPQQPLGQFWSSCTQGFRGRKKRERERTERCRIPSSTWETSIGTDATKTLEYLDTLRRDSW